MERRRMGRWIEESGDELNGGNDVGLNSFLNRRSLSDDILIPQYAGNSLCLNLRRRSQSARDTISLARTENRNERKLTRI